MSRTHRLVTDDRGTRGELVDELDPHAEQVAVRLDAGGTVQVDRRRIAPHEDGGYRYAGVFPGAQAPEETVVEERRIPLARERAHVRRETRETGRVRIRKTVHEHTETIDEPVRQERVRVERVPIDRVVEEAPSTRREGDTLVIPVVEERLVVTKQLVLKEEVRVTREERVQREPRPITLRSEEVDIEREGSAAHDEEEG